MWNFSSPIAGVKNYLRKREAKKLLKKVEKEEAEKRENLLQTSYNLSTTTDLTKSGKFYQSPAGRKAGEDSVRGDVLSTPARKRLSFLSKSVRLPSSKGGRGSDSRGFGPGDGRGSGPGDALFTSLPGNVDPARPPGSAGCPGGRGTATDPHISVCNIFWKPALRFHPYVHGEGLVDFGSLWPGEEELVSLLLESRASSELRSLLGELLHISLLLGPVRVLKVLVDLGIIDINQTLLAGRSLLHEACLSQNQDAVVFLTAAGADTTRKDNSGRMPENVCFSPKIRSLVAGGDSVTMVTHAPSPRQAPSMYDKQLIFDLIHNVKDIDDLLMKLQKFDFKVNSEADENGDYLIHTSTRQGISHVPVLGLLIKICHADINLQNKSGFTPLMIATEMGDQVLVETLLCVFGADPDVKCPPGGWTGGWTALHHAAYHNHEHIASMLIKRGSDLNLEDDHGARADDIASIAASLSAKEVIQMSRSARISELTDAVSRDDLTPADLKDTDLCVTDREGYTLIHNAARYNACGSLNILLSHTTAPVNAQHEKTLQTALAMAAAAGNSEIIRILIRHDACPTIRDIEGNLPLHLAIINGKAAAVETLLHYSQSLTGLQKGIELVLGQPEVHKMLRVAVQRRQREIVTPALYECSMSGNADKLYSSLEKGDAVNSISGVGDWPLYVAVENGHKAVTSLLLEWGGDVLRKHPSSGNSVLHVAASRGHHEIARLLVDTCERCYRNRADRRHSNEGPAGTELEVFINSFNYQRKTPIMLAAEKGYIKVVQYLLSRGASTAVLDPYTQTLYKCEQYEGVQFLLETYRRRHADIVFKAIRSRYPTRTLEKIFLPKFDHNLRDSRWDTPLMSAAAQGKAEVVRCSGDDSDTDSGAILDTTTGTTTAPPLGTSSPVGNHGNQAVTPEDLPDYEELEGSAYHDHISSLLDSMNSCKCASVFLNDKDVSHLCAVNQRDGRTAYHRAVEAGDNIEIIDILLNADRSAVNIQDHSGVSPLHLACQNYRKKTVEKLVNLNFVDLNCRTLDGTLPEEMTKNKAISAMVRKARQLQPTSSKCPLRSIPSSLFGSDHHTYREESNIDFDQLNTRFAMIKQQLPMGEFEAFL